MIELHNPIYASSTVDEKKIVPSKATLPPKSLLNDLQTLVQVMDQSMRDQPIVDMHKVEAIKQKIANQQMSILSGEKMLDDAERIAQKILALEQKLPR